MSKHLKGQLTPRVGHVFGLHIFSKLLVNGHIVGLHLFGKLLVTVTESDSYRNVKKSV